MFHSAHHLQPPGRPEMFAKVPVDKGKWPQGTAILTINNPVGIKP
jgi:hypothetical protein